MAAVFGVYSLSNVSKRSVELRELRATSDSKQDVAWLQRMLKFAIISRVEMSLAVLGLSG